MWVARSSLYAWADNPRKNDGEPVAKVAASIKRFGFASPIIARTNGEVIAGHTRLKAAEVLGLDRVPVRYLDLDPAEAHLLALADNKLNEEAEWHAAAVASLLSDYSLDDAALAGWDSDDLEKLANELGALEPKEVTEDEVPEVPVVPVTKPGDLWLLGAHRVLCGDSTKAEDVARLMGGEKADLCFTSPPYSDQRLYADGADLSPEKLATFITFSHPHVAMFCVNLGMKRNGGFVVKYWDHYTAVAESCGLGLLSWNVWDRSGYGYTIGQATAIFAIEHEFVFVFGKESRTLNKTVPNKTAGKKTVGTCRQANGSTTPTESITSSLRQLGTVFRCDVVKSRDKELDKHPAMFPIALPFAYIQACCPDAGSVYEPFLGSGTTLIAAEQLGRKCYGMEISPAYVDVIVKRWENLTGKTATLEAS